MRENSKKSISVENIKDPKELGVAIRRLRKHRGFSQSELAKKTGMIQATVSNIENGHGTLESFFKMIQVLKINLAISNESLKKDMGTFPQTKAQSVLRKLRATNEKN